MIQTQTYAYEHSSHAFKSEIAEARTFGFLQEVEALWARGLGRGGNLDNTVVLSHDGILNESGLRFVDEFVRHKVLDLIGDFSLLGLPFIGHLIADRSGHALHTRLVRQILDHPECWVLLNTKHADNPFSRRSSTIFIGRRSASVITSTAQPSQAVSQRFGLVLFVARPGRYDVGSEWPRSHARIKAGLHLFFFFGASSSPNTLTSFAIR